MVATQSSRNCDLSLLGLQLISDPETYAKYLVGFRFCLEFRILIAVRNESIGTTDLASEFPTKFCIPDEGRDSTFVRLPPTLPPPTGTSIVPDHNLGLIYCCHSHKPRCSSILNFSIRSAVTPVTFCPQSPSFCPILRTTQQPMAS